MAALMMAGALWVGAASGELSPSATPLEWSTRMANAEMQRLGTSLLASTKGTGRWDYTTGLYADALLRLTDKTHDPAYRQSAEEIISSFISPDGTIATYGPRKKELQKALAAERAKSTQPAGKKSIPGFSLDQVQAGVPTLKLYDLTGDERYRKAADILRRQLQKQPRVAEGGFWHKGGYPDQMWLDGLYMAEPFYADYAVRFKEPQDFDDIVKQFALVGEHTYDPTTGLFYHGWDATHQLAWADPKTGASPHFWSRAIGWYAMGLVDVLAVMPADDPRRPELVTLLRKVAAGILRYQDPKTGVWWQVTDEAYKPGNFPEASASCMFVYALARGVNEGVLPRSDVPAIRAGYAGIIRQFVTFTLDRRAVNLNRCCLVAGLDVRNKGSFAYYTQVVRIVPNDLKGVGPFITAGMECSQLFGRETFAP
jgi:unsaturated rhamnogalacturonyl hydrolase